jgi:hypothetical protein
MHLGKMQPDEKYVNAIREEWLTYADPRRTGGVNEFSLTLDYDGREFMVSLPDISGEICNRAWELRLWPELFDGVIKAAAGILVFVHGKKLTKGHTLTRKVREMIRLTNEAGGAAASPIPFDPLKAPTEVQLVDVLQMVDSRSGAQTRPLGIIISAWDEAARNEGERPLLWLARNTPFLSAFLKNRAGGSPVRGYGISALGGPLESMRARAHEFDRPTDRILVEEEDGAVHHDISAPIKWIADVLL